MYIKSIQVENYKSFFKTEQIRFEKGINLIVGKNNVGKTALLEALSLKFGIHPHKSKKSLPHTSSKLTKTAPSINFELVFTKEELQQLVKRDTIPFYEEELIDLHSHRNKQSEAVEFNKLNATISQKAKELNDILSSKNSFLVQLISEEASKVRFAILNLEEKVITNELNKVGNISTQNFQFKNFTSNNNSLKELEYNELIYFFNIHRVNRSIGSAGSTDIVLNDKTSNLAEVLNNLQNNRPAVFEELVMWIREIFPEIFHISVQSTDNSNIKIIIWSLPTNEDRNDLNISLGNSGTGVGHILSILYVVLASKTPQTILIDEPQSFLHPSAIRLLMDIFNLYEQHQYIIATHSPLIISYADASTIHLVSKKNGVSEVKTLDKEAKDNITEAFEIVGAQLSDYYGANNVLWVEGPTEQKAFKLIIRKLLKKSLNGIAILPVLHTGDFEGGNAKNKKLVIKIYNRLSKSSELLPPAIGFVFDRETRKNKELDELKRLGNIHFTKKRMYENYLLNASAIAQRLQDLKVKTTIDDIEALFEKYKNEDKYRNKVPKNQRGNWKDMIDAAAVLKDIFSEVSERKVEFRKTLDSIELTKLIIEQFPEDLNDIKEMLENIISKK